MVGIGCPGNNGESLNHALANFVFVLDQKVPKLFGLAFVGINFEFMRGRGVICQQGRARVINAEAFGNYHDGGHDGDEAG